MNKFEQVSSLGHQVSLPGQGSLNRGGWGLRLGVLVYRGGGRRGSCTEDQCIIGNGHMVPSP